MDSAWRGRVVVRVGGRDLGTGSWSRQSSGHTDSFARFSCAQVEMLGMDCRCGFCSGVEQGIQAGEITGHGADLRTGVVQVHV